MVGKKKKIAPSDKCVFSVGLTLTGNEIDDFIRDELYVNVDVNLTYENAL